MMLFATLNRAMHGVVKCDVQRSHRVAKALKTVAKIQLTP